MSTRYRANDRAERAKIRSLPKDPLPHQIGDKLSEVWNRDDPVPGSSLFATKNCNPEEWIACDTKDVVDLDNYL